MLPSKKADESPKSPVPETRRSGTDKPIIYNQMSRGVAQPGSAPALGAGGPRFKSARPDQSLPFQRSIDTPLAFY